MNILHIIFLRLTTKRRLQKKSKCSSRSASPWVTWSKHHGPGCRGCSSPAAGQRSASQEGTWQTGRSPWSGCTRGRQTCFLGRWSQCTIIIIDIIITRSSSAIPHHQSSTCFLGRWSQWRCRSTSWRRQPRSPTGRRSIPRPETARSAV